MPLFPRGFFFFLSSFSFFKIQNLKGSFLLHFFFFFQIVQHAERLKGFLQVIHVHLEDAPQVANHCCFAIHNIAEALHEGVNHQTYFLSQYYLFLIEGLLKVAYRNDGNEIGLRASAFEAIAAIIQYGARDTHESALKIVPHLMEKLNETFSMNLCNNDDREVQIEFQGYLCTILSHITGKVGMEILPFSEKILEVCVEIDFPFSPFYFFFLLPMFFFSLHFLLVVVP